MIEDMLNKPFGADLQGQSRKFICWKFCRDAYELLGLQLPRQHKLTRIQGDPTVPCIVLFRAVMSWHSGVVWPDGLHFVHVCSPNMLDPNPTEFMIQKDRLTAWPWKLLIEGFYAPKT